MASVRVNGVAVGGGSGLPAGATDNSIVRADGAAGLIQSSAVTIDDTGNIFPSSGTYIKYINGTGNVFVGCYPNNNLLQFSTTTALDASTPADIQGAAFKCITLVGSNGGQHWVIGSANANQVDIFQGNGTAYGALKVGQAGILIQNPAATFDYTIQSAAITAARTLNLPLTFQTETLSVVPQVVTTLSTPLNPTGTTNTTGLMMGLNQVITPKTTTRLLVTISGVVSQSTTADGAKWQIRAGTGAAPTNGAALTGTAYGSLQQMTFLTGVLSIPFSLTALITGLTVNTATWVDVSLAAITGGTATMTSVSVSVEEI